MVVYGFRHFFASNCLTHGIPITDVAEWMGHRSVDITFNVYRHLMPGSVGRAPACNHCPEVPRFRRAVNA
ncbi:tyrosine-type recombinase/integrase [Streptacidiphilus fuscans]|uniref:tyrosine-type recombinase/integrase n=1 Tax=Streptacidiphilus fuscans TaxID=2789292 RepID=UPI001F3ADDEB|nr:tyrosine-type recombinase/integrase [Streptacidiphilus fuscans]